MSLTQVERIGCFNHGSFVMNFSIQWLDATGTWQTSGWNSGNFDWGEYKVSPPLASIGVPDDAIGVTAYVNAVPGTSTRGSPMVRFAGNGRLAAYDVTGTFFDFNVAPLAWQNWTNNVVHAMTIDGAGYFLPTSRDALRKIILDAGQAGATVRVSGQRHSQAPLVTTDNRTAPSLTRWLVDMSCYGDLGSTGNQRMTLNPAHTQVTVNTGVREDELDAFLTANNLMLRTVTAGGFFSLGGMTAVDVHGATVDAPIFAETVSEFSIMGPDGAVTLINAQTPPVGGFSALQFARVSLGSLGVVTSVTIDVLPRPWATTLKPGTERFNCGDEKAFVTKYKSLLASHDRIESFINPYSLELLALWWDIDPTPTQKTPNLKIKVPDACALANREEFGAPYIGSTEPVVIPALIVAQYAGFASAASLIVDGGFTAVENFFANANKQYSDLWLTWASRVIFMSYFIEMPAVDDAGLSKAWRGLSAVIDRLKARDDFLLVAAMEFRFVRGGDSLLAGTYTAASNATFVNLDLIGYVESTPGSDYPEALQHFFADIERAWVAEGGWPHNGKMYGFYDPAQGPGTFSAPFNPAFLSNLAKQRAVRVNAFEAYRATRDPKGLFHNDFVASLLQT